MKKVLIVVFCMIVCLCSSALASDLLDLPNGISFLPFDIEIGDSKNMVDIKCPWQGTDYTSLVDFVRYDNPKYISEKVYLDGEPTVYFFTYDEYDKLYDIRLDFGFFEKESLSEELYSNLKENAVAAYGDPLGKQSIILGKTFEDYDDNTEVGTTTLTKDEWILQYENGYVKIELLHITVNNIYKVNIGAHYFQA